MHDTAPTVFHALTILHMATQTNASERLQHEHEREPEHGHEHEHEHEHEPLP